MTSPADLRWATVALEEQLEMEQRHIVLSPGSAKALLAAARIAQLPDDPDAVTARLLAMTDAARRWERLYRHAEYQLYVLQGGGEPRPDSTLGT